MLVVSDVLKNAFMQEERQILIRLTIGSRVFNNDNVKTIEYTSGSLAGDVFSIGSTVSNNIKVTFSELVEGLKELDEVTYEIGVKLPDETIGYVPMGKFIINSSIKMDRNNNKTSIECMDKMSMLGGPYVSSLTYPTEIRLVALEIANKAGVEVSTESFARLSADFISKPEGYTYREAIGLIAQFQAGFATFDRFGKLDVRNLVDPNFSIPPKNYFSKGLDKNEVFFRLGGISCTTDSGGAVIQSGNTAGNQIALENRVMTKELLDKIYTKIQTINYYPFSLSWQGNPVLEAGDWIEVEDLKGNKFKTPNLNYSLSFNGGMNAKSSAETATQSDATYGYSSPMQQKIEWLIARIDASGGNVVFEGIDTPENAKEGDLWFKIIGPDIEILIYKKDTNGLLYWDSQISTADVNKVADEVLKIIAQADADRIQAKADFEESKQIAKDYTDAEIMKFDLAFDTETGAIRNEIQTGYNNAITVANDYTMQKANEFNANLTTVQNNLTQVTTKANDAITQANQAVADVGFLKPDVATAKTNAATALSTAQTSLTNAATAISTANAANAASSTALGTANTSLTNANTALTNAQNALDAYNNLEIGGRNYIKAPFSNYGPYNTVPTLNKEGTITFTKNANGGLIAIGVTGWTPENAEYSISGIMKRNGIPVKRAEWFHGRFQTQSGVGTFTVNDETGYFEGTQKWTGISGWIFHTAISSFMIGDVITIEKFMMVKGNKPMDWTPAPESVQVQITDINGELARKVSQSSFDTLNGTVTNQGTLISQSQTAIGLKADKTAVDTINQTVTQHTTDIRVTSEGLALKADKSLVDTINGVVTKHTTDIKATSDGLALKADSSAVNAIKGTVDTHTTQIKATSDGLLLKADSSLVNTINGTVNTHTTQIKANSDGLALKADSSLVNAIKGTVDTHTTQISANSTAITARMTSTQVETLLTGKKYVNETTLAATSSGLTAQITQVSNDLSNLEIGGRNLVVRTNEFINSWLTGSEVYPNVSIGRASTMRGLIPVKSGEILNFSKKTSPTGSADDYWRLSWLNSNNQYVSRNVDQRNNFTLVVPSGVSFLWASYPVDGFPKIERGNKATDWTPAPEDMATLEKVVTIEANIDGINLLVANKAEQSQVTQLAGQVQTKVESAAYNTKMTQLDSAINLRVTATNVTAAILADKKIKDTRNDNQLPSWYYANYPQQTVEEFKSRSVMGISGLATYGQLTTKIPWNDSSGGVITQTFSSSDGIFQRVGSGSNWLAWDKIAESGKLISQINLSTEGILLQGKRIQLDGDVTMTAAFITRLDTQTLTAVTANIATIRASMLTADVINSTHLKVDNAMMDKLTATTAVVNYLFTKTAFVDNLNAKTLTAITANIATIRSQLLIANTVQATHLVADVATLTKLFATDANVQILTAKTAFINSVKAIDIVADRVTGGTFNAALMNVVGLNASSVVSGTFNGLTFTNPYIVNDLTGTTVLKGDLTSSYTKTNGQYGTMAFSRDRIFSNLYNSSGALVTGYNLSSEALNFNSSLGSATYNFDNIIVGRNDGTKSEIIYAYSNYAMQIHSDYGIKIGRMYYGAKETLIEVGTGNTPDIRFGVDVNLLTHDMYSVGRINFNTQSFINAPTADGTEIGARTFTKFTLSGWDAMYLVRDGSTGKNRMDMYGSLRMNGDIDLQTNGIYNSGRIRFNDQSYIDAPNVDSSRINARSYTAFTLSGWDVMYLVRNQSTGKNSVDVYATLNMQGNTITNQSDRRLKKNIRSSYFRALDAINRWNFVEYEWISKEKPTGSHLGLIAQDTPELLVFNADNDYYSIDSSKQLMMNSQAIQELHRKVMPLVSLTQFSIDRSNLALSEVEILKIKVAALENKIREMEEQVA